MPSRYYFADPMVMGPLEFLAGYGQAQRQTALQNIATASQQNQIVGQGTGQGVGNFWSAYAQAQQADRQFRMQQVAEAQKLAQQQQYNLELQRAHAEGQIAVEQVRTANDQFLVDRAAYVKRWGTTPEAALEMTQQDVGQPTQGVPLSEPAQPDLVGPPEPVSRPIPLIGQPIGPSGPGETTALPRPSLTPEQYEKRQREVAYLTETMMRAADGKPMQEQQAIRALFLPKIAAANRFLSQHEPPKRPTNYQEIIASGAVIPIPGSYNFLLPQADGTVKESSAFHPIPSPEETKAWCDEVKALGGIPIVQPDGKVSIEWPPSAKGGEADYAKQYDAMWDDLVKMHANDMPEKGKTYEPKDEEIQRALAKREAGIAKYQENRKKEQTKRDPRQDAIMARADELTQMVLNDVWFPEQIDSWKADIVQAYGREVDQWPEDVKRVATHLRDLIRQKQTPAPLNWLQQSQGP